MKFSLIIFFYTILLSGCSFFANDEEDPVEPPAELIDIDQELDINRVWRTKIGSGSSRLRLGLSPSSDGDNVYAGSYDGSILAFDIREGRRVWSRNTDYSLSAGPAYLNNILAFGTSDGDLVLFDSDSGEELWKKNIGSEILASPVMQNNIIAVKTVDGRIRGYSSLDGRELWSIQQNIPALTIRGNTKPIISGTYIVAGFDNGRLGAYELLSGDTAWEVQVISPSGSTEIDRLVDMSAGLQIVSGFVFAAGYNGRAVAVDLQTGQLIWQQEVSSLTGLGVDFSSLYLTDEFSNIFALDRSSGAIIWQQNVFRLRDLTAPIPYLGNLVVGDLEGFIHWIDSRDGRVIARDRVANESIVSSPLVVGDRIIVQSEGGTLAAYSISSAN
ncbi:MAG: outer membrane protein assembly factor BamB [Gammaproteobacteria bacterium TMED78]|nr:MAG: outer membrane protein assembly factor BamB [Gammaproteobacteria bacterium TMED78]|tara:strand:- start:45903 stop:47060 length:1158 start_codon:yes stop_codon:yes gene_type:complete